MDKKVEHEPALARIGGVVSANDWYEPSESGTYSARGMLGSIEFDDDGVVAIDVLVPEIDSGVTVWHQLPVSVQGVPITLDGEPSSWEELGPQSDPVGVDLLFAVEGARLHATEIALRTDSPDLGSLPGPASHYGGPQDRDSVVSLVQEDPRFWLDINEGAQTHAFARAHGIDEETVPGQRFVDLTFTDSLDGAEIYHNVRARVATDVPEKEFNNAEIRDVTIEVDGGTIVLAEVADAQLPEDSGPTQEEARQIVGVTLEYTVTLAIAATMSWVVFRRGRRRVWLATPAGAFVAATALAVYWRLAGIMGFREGLLMATWNFSPMILIWIPYSAMCAYLARSKEPKGWVFAAVGFGISLSLTAVFTALWLR